jgi:hypothetical protein
MTCAEFQRLLPDLMEDGENPAGADHVRSCPVCSDLVADLRHIAGSARLLASLEEPHPRVWGGIESALQREGLIRRPVPLLASVWWQGWAPLATAAVLLIVVAAALLFRPPDGLRLATVTPDSAPAGPAALAVPGMEPEDEQLLAELTARAPAQRPAFETNLRYVNAYIQDARQSLDNDPADDEAWQHLMHAYEQKAMLYEMAISHSLR